MGCAKYARIPTRIPAKWRSPDEIDSVILLDNMGLGKRQLTIVDVTSQPGELAFRFLCKSYIVAGLSPFLIR
jgi:hypothetical protein